MKLQSALFLLFLVIFGSISWPSKAYIYLSFKFETIHLKIILNDSSKVPSFLGISFIKYLLAIIRLFDCSFDIKLLYK